MYWLVVEEEWKGRRLLTMAGVFDVWTSPTVSHRQRGQCFELWIIKNKAGLGSLHLLLHLPINKNAHVLVLVPVLGNKCTNVYVHVFGNKSFVKN